MPPYWTYRVASRRVPRHGWYRCMERGPTLDGHKGLCYIHHAVGGVKQRRHLPISVRPMGCWLDGEFSSFREDSLWNLSHSRGLRASPSQENWSQTDTLF